jgi:hypothetical protein
MEKLGRIIRDSNSDRVLNFLKENRFITPVIAGKQLNIFCLREVCRELKRMNYHIEQELIRPNGENPMGKYNKYWLNFNKYLTK